MLHFMNGPAVTVMDNAECDHQVVRDLRNEALNWVGLQTTTLEGEELDPALLLRNGLARS